MNPITFLVNNFMLPFLSFSYENIYPNYGFGIILLTILVKLALYPLTHKQFESMKRMQVLHPKMKAIQEKYKKDPKRLQQETIKLYKDEKINPLSGCLPMLVQLPFLLALFYAMNSEAFKTMIFQPNVFSGLTSFWLPDLSLPDNLFILPIVIGVTTYLSQRLTPMTKDATQQRIMQFVPLVMVVVCWKMPAGVLLYWAASQLISMIQQMSIMKTNNDGTTTRQIKRKTR